MEYAYSPYHHKKQDGKKERKLPKIKLPKGVKKWIGIIVGIIILILFIFYLMLGELKFFANHFLGLTFFSKNYVVILQNDYELRPGGGFITGFGEISTFMGIPGNLTFKNSYEIDTTSYITPPYPHEELLKNEWYQGYSFRDANWDPHFPNAADELIKFYQEKFPQKDVDGLIVINFSLIEKLIDELSGISMNDKLLTKNNLFSELEFEVNNIDRHNIEALENRKNILGDLAVHLIKKVKRHPLKARDVLTEGLNSKGLYIWLKSDRLQNKLIKKGWANVMEPLERSDFLAMNLANLGSKKADRYVQTEVHYYANITKELPEITTEVTIRYPGFTNTYSDNYKGYLRLYIPKGADVIHLPLDSQEQGEGEFKMIGTKIVLPAGSKTSLSYTYTLPRNTFLHDQYQLRLIKQSGSEAFYKLTVETAEGKLMESDEFNTRENRAMFIGKLKNNLDLDIKILPDTTPPYPIEQEFTDLTHINIIWNEPMDPTTANDPKNFSIADLNKNNENTDEVNVIYAELIQPNIVQLELEGITDQTLEHYRIDIKGLKDQTGIVILPNPKSITAVQRIKPKSEVPEIRLGEIPETTPEETPAIE